MSSIANPFGKSESPGNSQAFPRAFQYFGGPVFYKTTSINVVGLPCLCVPGDNGQRRQRSILTGKGPVGRGSMRAHPATCGAHRFWQFAMA
eukprot:5832006-Amphidinium_carterae.1